MLKNSLPPTYTPPQKNVVLSSNKTPVAIVLPVQKKEATPCMFLTIDNTLFAKPKCSGQTTRNPAWVFSLCYHHQVQHFILLQTYRISLQQYYYYMYTHTLLSTVPLYIHHTCKRVLGVELFSNSLFRCFRPSFSSLPNAKHALGSKIWYIVEPHHHAEGVLVLS